MSQLPAELLNPIPEALRLRLQRLWDEFVECTGEGFALPEGETLAETLRVWALSDFVAQACLREPVLLSWLLDEGRTQEYADSHYLGLLDAALDGISEEKGLGEALRKFRRREMARIAWRDLSGRADLQHTTRDLSNLADACVDAALERLHAWLQPLWGRPVNAAGSEQRLVVLGMGKLGAHELNYSSDIDLIFAYPEDGETVDGRRSVSNQEFFVKLGQALIRVLDANTAHGFVFRVDMRLRPFGEASALALSFDAMETYYQVHGREWERYTMIKARVMAGDREAGAQLMAELKPFVYRKYMDFGAFESLREMKAMIAREVARKGMDDNVKLGAGGIREVEFIGQAFQLIRGGREPTLQVRPILTVLEALRGFSLLPDYVVDELHDNYIFLRNTEHRIQEWAEQQTHNLPTDEEGRLRLAFGMGFESWASFEPELRRRMAQVHSHFEQVFAAPQTEHAEADELDLTGVWQGILDEEQACAALQAAGYSDCAEVNRRVQALRNSRAFLSLGSNGAKRMNQLLPLLIGAVGGGRDSDATLERLLVMIEGVARRSAYLSLLVENPMALSQLVRLCRASPWIATFLSRHPQQLDELLDPRSLYSPPGREAIVNELRQRLLNLDEADLEAQMELLRSLKQSHTLRVAAADIMEAMPLMVVSDHLTDLAEVLVDAVMDLAWRYMIGRHGRPACGDDRVCDTGFAVIGYGKLGGIELGYGSDLDIVFLHSSDAGGRSTGGERPLDNAVFYARLAQRMIHLIATRTGAGELYEVDTRLRPSGASGLLVSSVDAFADYQREQAWTWEHQALVRARVVAGDSGIAEAFEVIRREILGRRRDVDALRVEVREMREKMRENLAASGEGEFDLKQDRGGIADIEFMVQYAVLAWSCDQPGLLDYTDNIRILERLAECGLLAEEESRTLCDAYRAYRARYHHLTLQGLKAVAPAADFAEQREAVQALWGRLMEA